MTTPARFALALAASFALASQGFAEEKAAADPMAGWAPPVVKNEKKDRQEIEAHLRKMEAASTSGLILVRKGGQWKAKAMAEGGWGDTPMAASAPGEAAPGTAK